ncbi:MAG: alpha-ketoglutarate decarboxylase [Lutibacter sp.]|nr:MAG: alpha-ketoglutarate decarboxylase [Lutibacter sp.]
MFNTINLNAQNSNTDFWDDVRFGGGFNVGFGSNYTTIAISPSAIYDFSDEFSTGLSLSYLYSKNKTFNNTANVYGASVISLYNPFDSFQLSGEFEELNINFNNGFDQDSYWNPALYLGAAYRTGGISIGLRYDVLYKESKSIYSSALTPVFRIYF